MSALPAHDLPARAQPGLPVRIRALALVLGVLALIAVGSSHELRVLFGRPADPSALHRVTAVLLTRSQGARFALPGGDELLRLVSNGLPPSESVVGADLDYTVHVEVAQPDGDVVVSRDIGFRSRETSVSSAAGVQGSAVDPAGRRISDSRRVDLPLPGPQPAGTVVTLSVSGEVPVLARAWTRQQRTGADQRLRSLGEADAARASALLAVPAWDHLDEAERANLARDHYVRLSPLGRPGTDHRLQTFYTRAVEWVAAEVLSPDLDAIRGLAVPLVGPARVVVRLKAAQGPARVTLERSAEKRLVLGHWALDPEAGEARWEGEVGPGLCSLELRADAPVFASVEAPGTSALPPLADPSPIRLAPTELILSAAPAGPDAPAVFDAEGPPGDPLARLLDLSLWGPPGALDVSLRVLDAHGGATLIRGQVELVSSGLDVSVGADGLPSPVAGPGRLRVLLPRDAAAVEVRPSASALVRFRVPLHVELDEVEAAQAGEEAVRLSHAPSEEAPRWSSVEARSPVERVTIRTYTRVEASEVPPPPGPGTPAASLSPRGGAERLQALEPVAPGQTERVITEIPGDRAVRLSAPRGAARARITYEVEDLGVLGRTIPVTLDGQPAGTFTPAMTRGTHRLPVLVAGVHTLAVASPPGLRVYANLPAAAGETASSARVRTLWRIGTGGVELTVPAGAKAVNVIVYDPASGPRPDVVLTARVDGGTPRRREVGLYTRLTPSLVRRSLPASSASAEVHLVDGDRPSVGRPRAVIVPLGDDLAPGSHRVTLTPSREIVARFFAYLPGGATGAASTIEEDE